jgi:hypothetical protein
MSERLIREALRAEFDAFATALSCVSQARPITTKLTYVRTGTNYSITASSMTPLRLRSENGLCLRALQGVRPIADARNRFSHIEQQSYFFELSIDGNNPQELIAFHWDREPPGSAGRGDPHLHVGPAILSKGSSFSIDDFHKVHIPSSHIRFPFVIRFLIEELGVEPLRPNWDEILANVLD